MCTTPKMKVPLSLTVVGVVHACLLACFAAELLYLLAPTVHRHVHCARDWCRCPQCSRWS